MLRDRDGKLDAEYVIRIEGNRPEWDYTIRDAAGTVASVSKELFRWTDTYVIDVAREEDALYALMFVLTMDAEKCSDEQYMTQL